MDLRWSCQWQNSDDYLLRLIMEGGVVVAYCAAGICASELGWGTLDVYFCERMIMLCWMVLE